jgi:hypothetical protein
MPRRSGSGGTGLMGRRMRRRRRARERGEEVWEGARGGVAQYGETGVRLQDVTERGVRRKERGKELPHISGRVSLEGRGAPGGPCRRWRLELHNEQATAPAAEVLAATRLRTLHFSPFCERHF